MFAETLMKVFGIFFIHFVLFLARVLLRFAVWLVGLALRLLVLLAVALVRAVILLGRALWWLTPRLFVLLQGLDAWTIAVIVDGVSRLRHRRALRAQQQ